MYIVTTLDGAIPGVCAGSAHMIGSWAQCARYIMMHGLRARAQIVPF